MSTAAEIHAKFFPQARPIVTAPHIQPVPRAEHDAAIFAAERRGEQRGYIRGLMEAKKAAAVTAALQQGRPMMDIATEVALKHGFEDWRRLRSRRRSREIVYARQEAMWLIARETGHSLTEIGGFLGGFDHTTVIHGIRAHEDRTNSTPVD